MDKYLLAKSNIININQSKIKNINLKIPSIYENNRLVFGKVYNNYYCFYMKGVKVKLTNIYTNQYFDTITNKYGEYLFVNVPQNIYLLSVNIYDSDVFKRYININDHIINNYDIYVCIEFL